MDTDEHGLNGKSTDLHLDFLAQAQKNKEIQIICAHLCFICVHLWLAVVQSPLDAGVRHVASGGVWRCQSVAC